MADPGKSGDTQESFRCPNCGSMFDTDEKEEKKCPVCGTVCTRETCIVLNSSSEDY